MEAKLKTKPDFSKYDTFSIGVSLNSRNHVGVALEAIVSWVNSQDTIKTCLIDLSDTLHRHNFIAEGYSPEAAYRECEKLGDAWIRENNHILNKLNVPYKIIRWSTWLDRSEFLRNKIFFERAIVNNRNFRQAIYKDIESFLNRRGRQNIADHLDVIAKGCLDYLIEELAVHAMYFEQHPSISVYPGRQQESFKMVRNGLVKNVPTGMQKSDYAGLYMHFEPQDLVALAA